MREKGFALPLILVVVTTGIVIGFFGLQFYLKNKVGPPYMPSVSIDQTLTPPTLPSQPDETANWQTYRNEKYGFEVKYPAIYSFHEIQTAVDQFYLNIATLRHVANNNEIGLSVIQNIDIYSELEVQKVLEREINDSPCSYTVKKISLGNYDAAKASAFKYCIDEVVLVKHPTKNLFLWLNFKNDHPKSDQILSTFKFLD